MARAMWRGAIQFGLVTIPVKLYLATEPRGGLSFNLLHEDDLQRIQMKVHCPEHGEIPRSDTVRGYEWAKGQYVVIEESDFEAVPLKTVRSIEIEQFVEAERERHSSRFVKQSYYLEPEAVGKKAFSLLREVLIDSQLQAICKIVLKDREQLAVLDPYASTMMLSTLYWPDEVRDIAELDLPAEEAEFKPTELAMARQLVDALTGEFDPAQYHDEYREALLKVIDAKVAGQPVEAAADERVETSKLTDLMAVLEASVAAARGQVRDSDKAAARADDDEPVSVSEARRTRGRATSGSASKPASATKATTAKGASTKNVAAKPAASRSKRADEPAARRRKTA
jgi:DNA end-binding protein Ku